MSAAPRVSVVVASFRARAVLDACLASLLPQCAAPDVEVLLARSADAGDLAALQSAYPALRVVEAPPRADVPRLRGAGLAAARGELALLLEDHCVAGAGWVAAFRRHAGTTADVIGGGMDNAQRARAVEWGAFFAEYGFFSGLQRPSDASPSGTILLTGANVAYARRVLPQVVEWMQAGAWENVVHERLNAAGARLVFEPAARVGQNLRYGITSFLVDRYEHGHDYARVRLAVAPHTRRWVQAAVTPLLPPLLTWRVAKVAVGSPARAWEFTRALPFTLAFLGAWAVGELVGYVRGPATESALHEARTGTHA